MTEQEAVTWLIYHGHQNHLRNQDIESAIEIINCVVSPSVLKLLLISHNLDNRLVEPVVNRIHDAKFLKDLYDCNISLNQWSTSLMSLCKKRLDQLPNSSKFITEE